MITICTIQTHESYKRTLLFYYTADRGECTHQYDEKQDNNNTLTSAFDNNKNVFSRCKRIDRQQKEEGSNEEDRQEEAGVRNVKNEYISASVLFIMLLIAFI